jgi:hypothetical protein
MNGKCCCLGLQRKFETYSKAGISIPCTDLTLAKSAAEHTGILRSRDFILERRMYQFTCWNRQAVE